MVINGIKTYIVAAIAVVGAGIGFYFDFFPKEYAITLLMAGLGLAGLRNGMPSK